MTDSLELLKKKKKKKLKTKKKMKSTYIKKTKNKKHRS